MERLTQKFGNQGPVIPRYSRLVLTQCVGISRFQKTQHTGGFTENAYSPPVSIIVQRNRKERFWDLACQVKCTHDFDS
ncbi:hypothetical protein GCM10027578_21950 [Spirosoma luteolum]